MKVFSRTLSIATRGRDRPLLDVTEQVGAVVLQSGVSDGLCTVFCQHTSASLVIQENADPRVLSDLQRWIAKIAPESGNYDHDDEGPDDMPAHLRGAITRTSETIPLAGGRMQLGTWQGIYLWEHRHAPHQRRLLVTVLGVCAGSGSVEHR